MSCEYRKKFGPTLDRVFQTTSSCVGKEYWSGRYKKTLDKLAGYPGSLAVLPFLAYAGLAILRDDGRPLTVTLKQHHPLEGMSPVEIVKMRTMCKGAETMERDVVGDRTLQELKKSGEDPRMLKVGPRIRRGSIDELPQIWSVRKGIMSLVGPRYFTDTEWENEINPNMGEYPYTDFLVHLNDGMKYGVLGLYVACGRSELSSAERAYLGGEYGKYASFKADLRIVGLSAKAMLTGKGAC